MNISFTAYYNLEFKVGKKGFRLYHDWIYDQVFADMDVDDHIAKLIRLALFKASWTTMWTGEIAKVTYEREVLKRARIPRGELRGKIIYNLPNEEQYIPLLIPWTKSENEILAKAANSKINTIQLHRDK